MRERAYQELVLRLESWRLGEFGPQDLDLKVATARSDGRI